MPKYRAGAFDKGSRTSGKFTVVEANSQADAMLAARPYFPGVPLQRFFAFPAAEWDQIDSSFHHLTIPKKEKGSR